MNVYLKETKEFQEVVVTLDGAPLLTNFELSLVPHGTRPTTWVTPTVMEGRRGLMIENLDLGTYTIYVKVTDLGERPVLSAGSVVIQ